VVKVSLQINHFPPLGDTHRHTTESSGGLEVPSSNLGAPITKKPRLSGAFVMYVPASGSVGAAYSLPKRSS
jgi:hypothetical protein